MNSTLQRIVDLLVKYKEYSTAIVLAIISLLLISSSSSQETRPFRTVAVGVVAGVQNAFDWIPNPYALQAENKSLRRLNMGISLEMMQLRDAGNKIERLQELLALKQFSPMKLRAAHIVGRTTVGQRRYATLDIGGRDSVLIGMPVITDQGLVGRIIGTNGGNSIVELIVSDELRLAGRTIKWANQGIIICKRGQIYLRNVPSVNKQEKGDTVVTSNFSSLFPPNIVIGTIEEVGEEQGTLFHELRLKPAVNFQTLEEAFVILQTADADRLKLEKDIIEQETEQANK